MKNKPNLQTNIAGIKMKNPVLVASGTFGYGDEIADLIDISKLGGIITKTITAMPKEGNPPPRLAEVSSGLLNSIGLQNIGLKEFINQKAPSLRECPVPVIVSVAFQNLADYVDILTSLSDQEWVSGIEVNLSCPNLEKEIISKDPEKVGKYVNMVKRESRVPVIAKLTGQVTDVTEIAMAAQNAGADAISLVNTFTGMAVDINTWKPKLANVVGGLSGPAIKPMALRCVWEVCKKVNIPVIGGGGISTAEDAVEFLLAGASAVFVGTATFLNPAAPIEIADGLLHYMRKQKLSSLEEIRGKLKVYGY